MRRDPRFSKDATEGKAHFLIIEHTGRYTSCGFIYPDGSCFWKDYKNRSTAIKKGEAFVAKHNAE